MNKKLVTGLTVATSLLVLILFCAASDGGAWEGADLADSARLSFGLQHVTFSIQGQSFSLTYDEVPESFNVPPGQEDAFLKDINDMKSGGKTVSAMIGLSVAFAVITAVLALLIWPINKLPQAHSLLPVSAGFLCIFSIAAFGVWLGKCHTALADVNAMGEGIDGLSFQWCFGLAVASFVVSLINLIFAILAWRASKLTPTASVAGDAYFVPVGGSYMPPSTAYQPLANSNPSAPTGGQY